VVNFSLGGFGNEDDFVSQAVDGATAAGILVVAAAGNDGPFWFSVGSPGAARTALTVGATNDADGLASFSSRGPTQGLASSPR
jgi:subtilisin family serine protease